MCICEALSALKRLSRVSKRLACTTYVDIIIIQLPLGGSYMSLRRLYSVLTIASS